MAEILFTRNIFLRLVSFLYLLAFSSLYVQIPGLYGNDGILPAVSQMDVKETDFAAKLQKKPTLLWFAPYLGLNTEYMMDVLALIGIFFSFTGLSSEKFCTKSTFTALWSLYYSLYQVGQTFMWFQWDTLLLETGFLCILLSPVLQKMSSRTSKKPTPASPSDHVSMWLVKWLCFRLIFSSGIVKLTSGCPSWWGLSALPVHFESQGLPTQLAYYFHHLPQWILKLGTVAVYFCEIFLPPLFFIPIKAVRKTAFMLLAFLQVGITLTGNYNFFTLLTFILSISLLEDDIFIKATKKPKVSVYIFKIAVTLAVYLGIFFGATVLFGLKMMPGGFIESKIMFTQAQFDVFLGRALPALIGIALFSLLIASLKALSQACTQTVSGIFSRIFAIGTTLFYIFLAVFLFADSLVPLSDLHPSLNKTVLPEAREWHDKLSGLHLTNSYGLFRHMTGVGGRPEVIIEGSNSLDGPWTEFQFKFKPGDLNRSLTFVAPHQPRLDWQMWFAALGTYHQNPWMMSLAYRILTGQEEVLKLMAPNPFAPNAPKYLKANLFKYHFVPWSERNSAATWKREKVGEYFPIFEKNHAPLVDYLKNLKIIGKGKKQEEVTSKFIYTYLKYLRSVVQSIEDQSNFVVAMIFAAFCAIVTDAIYVYLRKRMTQRKQNSQPTEKKKQNQRKSKN